VCSVFRCVNRELCPSWITQFKNKRTFPLPCSVVVAPSPLGAEEPFLPPEVLVAQRGVGTPAGVSGLCSDLVRVPWRAARAPGPRLPRAERKVGQDLGCCPAPAHGWKLTPAAGRERRTRWGCRGREPGGGGGVKAVLVVGLSSAAVDGRVSLHRR